jgi:hypothetical protein
MYRCRKSRVQSHSTPIVSCTRIFVTYLINKMTELTIAGSPSRDRELGKSVLCI